MSDDHQYFATRMRELSAKFGMTALQLDDSPMHTRIATNAEAHITKVSRERALEQQSYLKTHTVAYGNVADGKKGLLRYWVDR